MLAAMSTRKKLLLNVLLGLVWVGICTLGIVFPLLLNREHQKGINPALGKLIIYGQKQGAFAEWDREEAIKFSLDQIDSSIKYLFIGASAILGFILKVLIEPHVIKKEQTSTNTIDSPITRTTELLLIHSAIGCLISIICGFMGRLYFSQLADLESFSIYDEVGLATLGQLAAFVVGAGIILCAAISFLHV